MSNANLSDGNWHKILDFLTGGKAADITQSYVLIDGAKATYVLMDKV